MMCVTEWQPGVTPAEQTSGVDISLFYVLITCFDNITLVIVASLYHVVVGM